MDYILDEGMVILKPPMFPGLEKDVAIIAVAEKGFLNLELRYAMHAIILLVIINLNSTLLYSLPFILSLPFLSLSSSLLFILSKSVNGTGGHASMPPPHTSIGILSNAITKLENNPHPPSLLGSGPMLDFLGRELAFPRWKRSWRTFGCSSGCFTASFLRSRPSTLWLGMITNSKKKKRKKKQKERKKGKKSVVLEFRFSFVLFVNVLVQNHYCCYRDRRRN